MSLTGEKSRIGDLLYTETVMQTLAFIGIVIKVFFGGTVSISGTQGPASSTIWGYGLVLIAISGLFLTQYAFFTLNKQKHTYQRKAVDNNHDPSNKKKNLLWLAKGTLDALIDSIPTLGTMMVIIWLIAINTKYFTRINEGRVASEYKQYTTVSTIMIVLQLALIGKELYAKKISLIGKTDEIRAAAQATTGQDSAISYLLCLLSLIAAMMQNIVLVYFSTDA